MRCLHVRWGHLGQEVGEFGCGVEKKRETFLEGGIKDKGRHGDSLGSVGTEETVTATIQQ